MLPKLLQAFLTSILNPSAAIFYMATIMSLPLMFWIIFSFVIIMCYCSSGSTSLHLIMDHLQITFMALIQANISSRCVILKQANESI